MHTILTIEDSYELSAYLNIVLSASGYNVVSANSGREGIEAAHRVSPDLIMLDLGLPDLDGIDVLKELSTTTDAKVIILSARDAQEYERRTLAQGASCYLQKPCLAEEILSAVSDRLYQSAV